MGIGFKSTDRKTSMFRNKLTPKKTFKTESEKVAKKPLAKNTDDKPSPLFGAYLASLNKPSNRLDFNNN